MVATKRRTRLVLPTEKEPSMRIFFWIMARGSVSRRSSGRGIRGGGSRSGCGVCGGAGWRERNFEGDAAVELAAFFGVFVAQRLGGAHTSGAQYFAFDAAAQQQAANLLGALLAQDEVGAFDAGGVAVADHRHIYGLMKSIGLGLEFAQPRFDLGDFFILVWFHLGAAQRKQQNHGLDGILDIEKLLQI